MAINSEIVQFVFKKFLPNYQVLDIGEFDSGHINSSYLIKTSGPNDFVLQRINSFVFKKAKELIENKIRISEYLENLLNGTGKQLQFVRRPNGSPYYCDSDGEYWNMSVFISGSKTLESVDSAEIAYEGGKLIGDFLNYTNEFDANSLHEILTNFHEMSFRFNQFEEAVRTAGEERLKMAAEQISFAESLREEMHLIERYKNEGKIQLRVTHNDTKISNVLFDKNNAGICMIDTDTVMMGIAHYDFGDAVRTFCSTAVEDERDLSKVGFNMSYFESLTKGFLEKMYTQLSDFEIGCMALAGKTITFIMGLRMLTDFLNNDTYYKTAYDNHNLDRAKNQFKLVREIEANMATMNAIIQKEYQRLTV